jgi:glyoxylase-like metal-dependent hydrolase (beta-lactamase superfamily II)
VLLTGDTLFLAAVGRPDLHENADEVRDRARTLYRSLQQLMLLPSETIILPGHSSEPIAFDGRAVSALLGQVRGWLDTLSISEDVFVDQVIAHLPPTPANYERIVMFNKEGLLPESDSTELEAGANRCAVA